MSGYEVTAPFVEVVDPRGHAHWLGPGSNLPDWVDDDTVRKLLANEDVFKFERI